MKKEIVFRDYQEDAIEQGVWSIGKYDNNSLIVMPTGAGKSLIVAGMADRLRKECLILQPSKEILEQNMQKLSLYVPEEEIGVYSASFKRKDIKKYNFATIQSIYKVPELFKHIDLCFVDECDLVNQKNKNGMFTSFLRNIGDPTTIGLTATPFRNVIGHERLKNGNLLATSMLKLINRMNPRLWNRVVYNINNHELVEQGYLCPLNYESRTVIPHKKIPTNNAKSDFDLEAFAKLLEPFEAPIVESINRSRKVHNAVLVFCASVDQAERMAQTIHNSASVSGKTPIKERDRIIKEFREGTIDVVFNVGVLTTGFDMPELDCIYLLRPTRSLRLLYQMLGRGVRLFEGKTECNVIDYTGTVEDLGKIEDIKLVKEFTDNGYPMWELYSNGERMHGKGLFTFLVQGKQSSPKLGIKLGSKSY